MQNADIARLFDELADLLEVDGANPFRIRAYRNAVLTLEDLPQSVSAMGEEEDLSELPGIGKDLAAKIREVISTGELKALEEMRQKVPHGVVEMLRISGLGPKKAKALWKELGVASLDDLRQAIERGDVAKLKGFGQKSQEKIAVGLTEVEQSDNRTPLGDAEADVEEIAQALRQVKGVLQVQAAGSYRRRRETVGDLDLLASAEDSGPVMNALAEHSRVQKVLSRGETKQRVKLRSGLEMDLRVVPDESFGAALQYFTGNKEHNIILRKRAQQHGWKLNEYGIFADDKQLAGKTEEDVYAQLELPWIPPVLRENRGEIEQAETGTLPQLVELKDIRGDLHMHTTASDGKASIREMAEAAKELGYQYIAITDHSKRVSMANGLDAKRLRAHWNEIEKVRGQVSGIEILKGIECDILEDATMDLDDDVLSEADWVIAVLHYGLKQPRGQITKRLLAAIENPHVDAIGHLSGRLLAKRAGADVDFDTILKGAADNGVLLEINAHPHRLDIDDVHAAQARELGIPIVINTDAHSTGGLDLMHFGIEQAQRAGLEKGDVANTMTWKQFQKRLQSRN